MLYDGREVANYVLDHCDRIGRPVSNMALQKIVFFCHVWSLIDQKGPLIKQSFEAWEHGPVLQYLYHQFKEFGDQPITSRAEKVDKLTGKKVKAEYGFDPETEDLLAKVVAIYSRYTASELRRISHVQGGPWANVWYHGGKVNPGMKLDNGDIAEFYSSNPPPLTKQ